MIATSTRLITAVQEAAEMQLLLQLLLRLEFDPELCLVVLEAIRLPERVLQWLSRQEPGSGLLVACHSASRESFAQSPA